MKYYTSDLHLGHERILKLSQRPFKDLDEMHEAIYNNWKNRVSKKDEVYIVGDIGFGKGMDSLAFLDELPGRKILVIGNHDTVLLKDPRVDNVFESKGYIIETSDNKRKVSLCHYPMAEWNNYFKGTYHVYGHTHNNNTHRSYFYMKNECRAFNCGVDVNNFTPSTLDELMERKINGML